VPSDLAAFLEAGPPRIYVGFGSMPIGKSKLPMLLEALRLSERRAVIARGWGAWGDAVSTSLGARVHVIDAAPHRKLFPLDHGGTGITGAGLSAGKPTLVTSWIGMASSTENRSRSFTLA